MRQRRPRAYFSFRSPFSWLSLRRLYDVLPDLEEHVDLVPFWDPSPQTLAALRARGADFHYVQMLKAKHLYILHDTKRIATRLGASMAWPVDIDPWWELPHLAWLHARSRGLGRRAYDAFVAARWERGEDICEEPVVRAIAGEIGIAADELVGAATDPALCEEGVAGLERAWEDDVFGVPYFLVGRERFWGYDRIELVADALLARSSRAAAAGDVPEAVAGRVGSYDQDTAGGCG